MLIGLGIGVLLIYFYLHHAMTTANEKLKQSKTKKMKNLVFDALFHNDDMPYVLEILKRDMYKTEVIIDKGDDYKEVIFSVNEYLTNIMINDFFHAGRKRQLDSTFSSLKNQLP